MRYFILFILLIAGIYGINILAGNQGRTSLRSTYNTESENNYSMKMLGDMINADVTSRNGNKLGFIQDIVIDTKTKVVSYAVLSYKRGSKLFAVPINALQYNDQNKSLVLDMNYEILDSIDGFDKNNWPEFADTRLALGTDNYFQEQKSWEPTISRWESIISGANYKFRLTRLSDLLNYKIESEKGDLIGYVNDVILSRDNHIEYVAVFIWDNSLYDVPFKYEFIPFKELKAEKDNSFRVKSSYYKELYTDNYTDYCNGPYSLI